MNCKNVQSRLSAYVDRELSGHEMHELREHIDECDACREEESAYRSLKRLLGGVSSVEPSPGFEDRLLTGVFGRRSNEPRRRPAYLVAVFAAAAAMVTTLLLLPSFRTVQPSKGSIKSSSSNDYALEINRDQLYEASSDPLSGGHFTSPAVYGR